MRREVSIIICLIFFIGKCNSQISSPGLGNAKNASWFAIGFKQKLDTIKEKGWHSFSYIGLGRKSNPDNHNPFYKSGILVVNQEFYNQFHNNWQYSFALSYRKQNDYSDQYPYDHKYPGVKQEFRLYGRFSNIISISRFKITTTYRQEFRSFFTPKFQPDDENLQLRSRFRLQLTASLDKGKKNKLIFSSEQLFSTNRKSATNWSPFKYSESRFSLYYSHSLKNIPVTFNIGNMNNLIGTKHPNMVHYLAFDLIIHNLFSH